MRSIPFGRPITGDEEKKAVCAVIDSGLMVHGPKIEEFEEAFAAFTEAPYAVGVSSCTAALHLAFFSLGIGPGDEVIVPAMTHTATAHAVSLTGARPVFIDAELKTGNIDTAKIEAALTSATKAIAVVHYLGLPVNMEPIMKVSAANNLPVIEDCALSIGAYYQGKHTGLTGTCGCFSFYPVKHITTGEGGMLITKDKDLADRVKAARAFGIDRHHGTRKTPGFYDAISLGFNYRMSEINAALGIEQLKRLPFFLEQRKKNYTTLYKELQNLPGISLLSAGDEIYKNSFYCLVALLEEQLAPKRAEIMEQLSKRGVGTSIYYPHPVPRMTYYRNWFGYQPGSYPQAERISDSGLALPVGPHLGIDDMHYIAEQLNSVIQSL